MLGLAVLATPMVAAAVCGDGTLDVGEQCDPGPDVADDCCTAGCDITSAAPAFVCRPAAGACDVPEACDGVSDACPADGFAPDGTACDSGDTCAVPDTCQGGVCQASGPDGDGDGVCDASDNCPADANAGQADLDGDSTGDVCDADDGPLNPIKIAFKLNTGPSPIDNSFVKTKGDFVTLVSGDVFDASAPITLWISDGKSPPGSPTIRSHTFLPSACLSTTRKVKCVDGDYRLSFVTSPRRPGVWKFKAQFKQQNLTGPLQGPATAILTYGPATDRVGDVPDCKGTFTSMSCRDYK
jgi:hypothetical protein